MRATPTLCAVVLLAWPALAPAESKFLLKDPAAAHRIDYIIIAGDKFADTVAVLAAHREKHGLAVGIAPMSAVMAKFESVRAFLAHAVGKWKPPAPSYALLVGDVDIVPALTLPQAYKPMFGDAELATDFDYAQPTGGKLLLHVGRFPCHTADELATMVRKTIAYESELAGGDWQRKLNLVAGIGGYGKKIDSILEAAGMFIASTSVPYEYEMEAAYGNPDSAFCPYPPKFNEHVVGMLNRGSLLTLFVGHGDLKGMSGITWNGQRCPVFDAPDVKSLAPKGGLPIMVAVACHTGRYDRNDADCLGEACIKAPNGPVAFVGGSRRTEPYANGLFAKAFIDAFFGTAATLGEVMTRAKQAIIAHRISIFTIQADAAAGAIQGKDFLKPMREDVVRHYNLLGDPALVIRRPNTGIRLEVNGAAVRIAAPGCAKVELALEYDRLAFPHPPTEIKPDDPEFERKITERYRRAHERVISRWSADVLDGGVAVEIKLPRQPGRYVLKAWAFAQGTRDISAVSTFITVEPPKAQ